jgi:polar amino acid transport system permease protein
MTLRYTFDWSTLSQEQHWHWLLDGMAHSLLLGLTAALSSLLGGAALAALRARRGALGGLANLWAHSARNFPALFWIVFLYFGLSALLPLPQDASAVSHLAFAAACALLALTLDNTTYVSDALLDGLRAVSRDERQAALACGLSERQAMRSCLLPVAVRHATPALLNRSIHVFKNTSLAMAIAVPEMMWATQQIESITFRALEATAAATAFYLSMSLVFAVLARWLTQRFAPARAAQVWS